jgi:hypothetical protein
MARRRLPCWEGYRVSRTFVICHDSLAHLWGRADLNFLELSGSVFERLVDATGFGEIWQPRIFWNIRGFTDALEPGDLSYFGIGLALAKIRGSNSNGPSENRQR